MTGTLRNQIRGTVSTLLGILAMLLAGPATADFSVMLSITPYSEEAQTWCGPATGQMIMEGYPAGACTVLQEDVWMQIVTHKTEALWDTDPAGLQGAMTSLCPPAYRWSIYDLPDRDAITHSMARWIAQLNYPVAVLLDTAPDGAYPAHAEHWAVVAGIVTDLDPRTNTSVTLKNVLLIDPSPPELGGAPIVDYLNASEWAVQYQPVSKVGSVYHGDFVALIEPPQVKGVARMPQKMLVGKLIGHERARLLAAQYIKEQQLAKLKPFSGLAKAKAMEPMLVNPGYAGYYLIPYALDGKAAQFAVIVNAYSGEFEQAGAFAPTRYVSKSEAILLARDRFSSTKMDPQPDPPSQPARDSGRLGVVHKQTAVTPQPEPAGSALGDLVAAQGGRSPIRQIDPIDKVNPQPEPPKPKVELVLPLGERHISRYFPIWKVSVGGKSLAVSQQREVLGRIPQIEPFIPIVATRPTAISWDSKHLLILDREQGLIQRVDAASGAVLKSIQVEPAGVAAMASDGEHIWTADVEHMQIRRLNASSGEVTGTLPLLYPKEKGFGALTAMTWDGSYLWTAISAGFSSSLNRIDPLNGEIVQSVFADCDPRGIASDGNSLWTLCYNGKRHPAKIDSRPILVKEHEMLQQRRFIQDTLLIEPKGLVYDGQHLQVLDAGQKRIFRYPSNPAE